MGGQGLEIAGLKSALAGPFDLALAPGETLAVLGPSGAGKSLLLRMIADLDANTGGVRLNGLDRASLPAPAWRRRSPYVAAESGWWANAFEDHLAIDLREPARDLAGRLAVGEDRLTAPIAQLSTGERQRLALVRAFVLQAPLMLLDEPTGPLDAASTAAVEAVLAERTATGAVVILVSHDEDQARRLGARRLRIADRRPAGFA